MSAPAAAPIRVAINGFGRIGRLVFRIMRRRSAEFKIVAIHDLAPAASLVHLLKYDTTYRKFPEPVSVREADGNMLVGNDIVYCLGDKCDPKDLPWAALGVDCVVESTGIYRARATGTKDGYDGHLAAGAKKVIITVPTKDVCDNTIVMGVNEAALRATDKCISNASCTTNCLAPVCRVLEERFGIVKGLMTTVHAYTNDQRVADQIHEDLRRARAAAMNIIPTTTGAAKAVAECLPVLKGKLDGFALRVPVVTGSCVDLTWESRVDVKKEEINAAIKAAADGPMRGILDYTAEPIVSSDIVGCQASSIFDGLSTMVIGKRLVKILSWYDNEWGYSERVVDLMKFAFDRFPQ
ncbi:Glyceraldehyde-3-phosphate dehydrogenase [Paratrimastix pyriformis]|uniref:Glyceraldehyde-3-phosphate dehydrogenase n=1 Tax=Paratrimastix pyriformis TaxID=342808 RepID=A0SNX1_9EUKA|nr:glyceraldehyde-3-phopshate dehydrogenase [Paratrimastix pyriformis]KAJ4456838.1 Glyceraldehyde-3-phosphate dehydrogenase [Paratrimastix pyriformis]